MHVRAAAHVAQDYWDRYDKAQGWTSSIGPSSKTTSGFEGGKSFKGGNRPLDVGSPSPSSRHGACVFKCTCIRTDVEGDAGGRVLLPRRTYVPKRRSWEGSGVAGGRGRRSSSSSGDADTHDSYPQLKER